MFNDTGGGGVSSRKGHKNGNGIVALERPLPRTHAIEDASQAKQVATAIDLLARLPVQGPCKPVCR